MTGLILAGRVWGCGRQNHLAPAQHTGLSPPFSCLPASLLPPSCLCAATYFTFAAVGVVAVVIINAIVPETKGKTLEEIEALWEPAAGTAGGGGKGEE